MRKDVETDLVLGSACGNTRVSRELGSWTWKWITGVDIKVGTVAK